MNNSTNIERPDIVDFKGGVDSLLSKRAYMLEHVVPHMVEGQDFYVIKGRHSLSKGGSEKICSVLNCIATFTIDSQTMECFKGVEGLVAYICNLTRNGEIVAQGRGAATLKSQGDDVNKCVKVCEKRAFISAVIRASSLGDIFSCDLEDMKLTDISPAQVQTAKPIPSIYTAEMKPTDPYCAQREWDSRGEEESKDEPQPDFDNPMTEKQRSYLTSLICEKCAEPAERERWLSEVESCDKFGASAMIGEFLSAVPRY